MADVQITRKAGVTEPETFTVKAEGSAIDFTSKTLDYGQWKMWARGSSSLTIDPNANGATSDGPGFSVSDQAGGKVELDPDGAKSGGGNAFDTEGVYLATLHLHFTDGDDEIWPDKGYVQIRLEDPGPSS